MSPQPSFQSDLGAGRVRRASCRWQAGVGKTEGWQKGAERASQEVGRAWETSGGRTVGEGKSITSAVRLIFVPHLSLSW